MALYKLLQNQSESGECGFPELKAVADQLGIADPSLASGSVTLPASLFRQMLTVVLDGLSIDEDGYLKANPDVAEALAKGDISSAKDHFVKNGYFEGRTGWMSFDAEWYLKTYPDVAEAIKSGLVKSAQDHFVDSGRREGRLASAAHREAMDFWASL